MSTALSAVVVFKVAAAKKTPDVVRGTLQHRPYGPYYCARSKYTRKDVDRTMNPAVRDQSKPLKNISTNMVSYRAELLPVLRRYTSV